VGRSPRVSAARGRVSRPRLAGRRVITVGFIPKQVPTVQEGLEETRSQGVWGRPALSFPATAPRTGYARVSGYSSSRVRPTGTVRAAWPRGVWAVGGIVSFCHYSVISKKVAHNNEVCKKLHAVSSDYPPLTLSAHLAFASRLNEGPSQGKWLSLGRKGIPRMRGCLAVDWGFDGQCLGR
jgi:hypothetical protein